MSDLDLSLAGLASNFDWHSLVDQLTDVERAPERRMQSEQSVLQQRQTAYGKISTALLSLKGKVDALKEAALFTSRQANVADDTVASVSVGSGAAAGSYDFSVVQLATAAAWRGLTDAGSKLNATDDVSVLALSSAGFATAITAGTFTVNGKQVTIATSDTLQQVFDKISTATGGEVTGAYDSDTDTINLSSGSAIVLGSATDISNFLSAAKLHNNGTGSITSSSALGVVKINAALASANLATPVNDGGSGAGQFKINGVSISFDASTDTAADVMARINNSAAGVSASYDPANDRLVLTNKTTGDVGVALEDVTGNFLAATGLLDGSLTRGKNLIYTIDGGEQRISESNTVSDASLPGITITALKESSTQIDISSDTGKIRTAITDFISEYNKAQSLINTNTASSTDAKGQVTAGVLAADREANELASRLRKLANSAVSGLSGTLDKLERLGIESNGNDDTLALKDSAKLDTALANSLADVEDLFANSTSGLAVQLSSYLDRTAGDDGSLVTKQNDLGKAYTDLDTQIADAERLVLANRQRLVDSFVAMEKAQAQINQQMQFLLQRFGTQ